MINNAKGQEEKIIQVAFWFNVIFFAISFFFDWGKFFYIVNVMNIVLLGTCLILRKFGHVFDVLIQGNRMAKQLNNALGKLNG